MTANDFNVYIKLPDYCESLGIKGFEFIKVPRFGWFAVNKSTNVAANIFDFIKTEELIKTCEHIIRERDELHERRIHFNEMSLRRLANDVRHIKVFLSFLQAAVIEFQEGQLYVPGGYVNPAKWMLAQGFTEVDNIKMGLITASLIADKAFRQLNLQSKLANKLLIPSFCSPNHPCAYETASADNLGMKHSIFVNEEKGWYGCEVNGPIVRDFQRLMGIRGCTWEQKLDYWTTKKVTLDYSLTVGQCLQLWTEADKTQFETSPLDLIEKSGDAHKIKLHLQNLKLRQIKELEERFGLDLTQSWREQKREFIRIGYLGFIKKDNRYYLELKNGVVQEFTNFAITMTKIVKRDGEFYRQGVVDYENKEFPFEFNDRVFTSCKTLVKTINRFFLENGIGIPIIFNNYQGYLIDVINRFNAGLLVEP